MKEFYDTRKYNIFDEPIRYFVRGIIYKDGDVYIWPVEILHDEVSDIFPDTFDINKVTHIVVDSYDDIKESIQFVYNRNESNN